MAATKSSPSATRASLIEKARRGEYQVIDPIDYILLGLLPNVGEIFAGLYPMGETVTNLREKFTPEQQKHVTSTFLSSRMRVMHIQELCAPTYAGQATNGKMVWQRTKAGETLYKKWKATQNGASSNS